jgi:hypothetical protein
MPDYIPQCIIRTKTASDQGIEAVGIVDAHD